MLRSKHIITVTITAALALLPALAAADPEKSVGVGIGVGVATGPNVQLATERTQLDLGLGIQGDDRLRFQADHAWRLADMSGSRHTSVPLYLGVGGFVTDRRNGVGTAGVRMPIGVQADFARAPIQLFGELAPELVLVEYRVREMDAPPRDALVLTGLAGVRAAF